MINKKIVLLFISIGISLLLSPGYPVQAASKITLLSQNTIYYSNDLVYEIDNNTVLSSFDHYDIVVNNEINFTGTAFNKYIEIKGLPDGTNNATAYAYDISNVLIATSNTIFFQNEYTETVTKPNPDALWIFRQYGWLAEWFWQWAPYFIIFILPTVIGVYFLRKFKNDLFRKYRN